MVLVSVHQSHTLKGTLWRSKK